VPIVQTDGASHYVYAKTFAEQGFYSANPKYNWYGSAERYSSEYPPLSPFVLGMLMQVLSPVMLLNGLYGALFAVLGAWFLYKFVEELLDSEYAALIAVGLYILNVRMYVGLHIGLYANSIAYFLTFPALYFALRAFKRGGRNWAGAFISTGLISLAYPLHTLFVLFMQVALWKGVHMKHSFKIEWPKVNVKIKNLHFEHLKDIGLYFLGVLLFLGVVLKMVIFSAGHARAGWIGQWLSKLLASNCTTYPCIWKYFLLLDGPLLVIGAGLGFLYAIYRNNWLVAQFFGAGWFIVLCDWLFIEGDAIMLIYFYRYYVTFFVVMAVTCAYLFTELRKNKQWRQIAQIALVLMFVIQGVKLGMFFSQIGPAMAPEDVASAQFLHGKSVYYFNNLKEVDTFRSFKWLPVTAETNVMEIGEGELDVESALEYDYLYIGDGSTLTLNYPIAFRSGKTVVYDVR